MSFSKIILTVLLVGCLILGGLYRENIETLFGVFLEWIIVNPIKGSIYYVIIYGISAVFCIPAVILTLGCGYIYTIIYPGYIGLIIAFIIDFIGATFGAVLAFYIAKLLFSNYIQKYLINKYETLVISKKLLTNNSIKIMIILRIIMPYNITNYFLGITNVHILQYILSCFAMFPSTIAWCFIGSTLKNLSDINNVSITDLFKDSKSLYGFIFIGILLTAFMGFISYKAKNEFQKNEK